MGNGIISITMSTAKVVDSIIQTLPRGMREPEKQALEIVNAIKAAQSKGRVWIDFPHRISAYVRSALTKHNYWIKERFESGTIHTVIEWDIMDESPLSKEPAKDEKGNDSSNGLDGHKADLAE